MTTAKQTFFISIAAAAAAHLIVSFYAEQGEKAKAATIQEPSKPAQVAFTVPRLSGNRPRLDLAFCIDTTGSMQGEIDTVKAKVKSVVAKLTSGQPKPQVRVGLVAYRDYGDDYITKVYPLNNDIDKVVQDISDLSADGGGDGPEAVEKGVNSALNQLDWDSDKRTAKLLFLIGDAPPHDHAVNTLSAEARKAAERGIRINTIACDGFESDGGVGVETFRQVASLTNGNFQKLAYEQEVADASGKKVTVITEGAYLYKVKAGVAKKVDWKEGGEALAAKGLVEKLAYDRYAPSLQGATNGTIGPQGADATIISGVNTAGTVRVNNNLDSMMFKDATDMLNKVLK